MAKIPSSDAAISIAGSENVEIRGTKFRNPSGVAIELDRDTKKVAIDGISVTGGASAFRILDESSPIKPHETANSPPAEIDRVPSPKARAGWSRAYEANFPNMKSEIMQVDLSDAVIKLSRARDHISDLEVRLRAYLATDFYRLRVEPDEGGRRIRIVFDSLHQPDKSINALIGDAIGNLRSSLDYIAVALTYPITGKTDDAGFPFADSANGFAGEVRAKKGFGHCSIAIQEFFITDVQAYERGEGKNFWILNKLRNIDKHRLLFATTEIASVDISFRDKNGNTFKNIFFGLNSGQSGTLIDAPADYIEIRGKPKPAFQVMLQEPPYIQDVPVLEFLHEAARATEDLLDRIKAVI